MHGRKSEKGVFLIFTAILLPLIFLCIAFAVDLGYAYAGKSKLQNAADASVLACAHQYSNGTEAVKSAVNAYMKSNLGNSNYKINSLTYGKKDNDNSNSVLITLVVSQDQPTFFSKIIGIKKIPVAVKASSLVEPKEEAASSIFKYMVFGNRAYLGYPPPQMDTNARKDDWTVKFDNPGVVLHGAFYTNGATAIPYNTTSGGNRFVYLDGTYTTYADGLPWTNKGSGDADYWRWTNGTYISKAQYDERIYSDYDTGTMYWNRLYGENVPIGSRYNPYGYYYMARMAYMDGSDVVVNKNKRPETYSPSKLSAELSENNPLTKGIFKYANDVAMDLSRNGNNSKYGKVYYDGGGRFNMPGWEAYNVVIVDGDVHYKAQNYNPTTKNPYVVLISLSGNIKITGNFRGELKALVYAPNGTITYNSPSNFRGSLVGNRVVISEGKQFQQDDFGFGKSGGGDGSVKLYEDNGKVYTTTASI